MKIHANAQVDALNWSCFVIQRQVGRPKMETLEMLKSNIAKADKIRVGTLGINASRMNP